MNELRSWELWTQRAMEMDPKRIAELPTAQLRSLDANLDNVLEAMEYCE